MVELAQFWWPEAGAGEALVLPHATTAMTTISRRSAWTFYDPEENSRIRG